VQGNTGDRVREVQCLLDSWGFDIGSAGVDGRFGPDTAKAVRSFQAWFGGLTIDGKVGANTWRRCGVDLIATVTGPPRPCGWPP